jgi:hypothetical protein
VILHISFGLSLPGKRRCVMLRALTRNSPLLLPLAFAIALLPDSATAQGTIEPIGIIDSVAGHWVRPRDRERLPLIKGEFFYADQTVASRNASSGHLGILMFATGERWTVGCSAAAPCAGTYRAPTQQAAPRGFWSFLSSYWTPSRRRSATLGYSRGAARAGPAHAYIPVERTPDLRPALTALAPGRYSIRIMPAPDGSLDERNTPRDFTITLAPGRPVPVDGLPFGLYLLSVNDANGQTIGSNALVLLRAHTDRQSFAIWNEAQQKLSAWSGMNAETKDALLAQTLYALDARRD